MTETIARMHSCVASGEFDKTILDELQAGDTKVGECEVLDFKQQLPATDLEYAKTVRDLVALHNSFGGFLVFGVQEVKRDRAFEVVGIPENIFNLTKTRDLARTYVGRDLRITSNTMQIGNVHLEVVWVAKRALGRRQELTFT